jgi:hypothetical protein
VGKLKQNQTSLENSPPRAQSLPILQRTNPLLFCIFDWCRASLAEGEYEKRLPRIAGTWINEDKRQPDFRRLTTPTKFAPPSNMLRLCHKHRRIDEMNKDSCLKCTFYSRPYRSSPAKIVQRSKWKGDTLALLGAALVARIAQQYESQTVFERRTCWVNKHSMAIPLWLWEGPNKAPLNALAPPRMQLFAARVLESTVRTCHSIERPFDSCSQQTALECHSPSAFAAASIVFAACVFFVCQRHFDHHYQRQFLAGGLMGGILLAGAGSPEGWFRPQQLITYVPFSVLVGLILSLCLHRVRPEWRVGSRPNWTICSIAKNEACHGDEKA